MAVESWALDGLALNTSPWRIESLEFAPAPRQPQWIKSQDSDGGLLVQDPVTDLAEMTFRLRMVAGFTHDQALANILALSEKAASCSEDPAGVGLVNVPHDSSKSVTYRALLGEITDLPRDVSGGDIGWFIRRPVVTLRLTCHPFGELPALANISDTFATDTLGNYTFGVGSGTLAISGGLLVPSSTAEKELYHSASPWPMYDTQVTLKVTTGASVAGPWGVGVVAKRLDANNYLYGEVAFSGASSQVKVWKKDGGAFTNLASSSVFTPTAATSYWVRLRVDGQNTSPPAASTVVVEIWSTAPTPNGTPLRSTSDTLAGANETKFGRGIAGRCGIRTNAVPTDYRYDDFTVEPNVWRSTNPVLDRVIYGIEGDAPPKLTLISSNGSAATSVRYEELGLGPDVAGPSIIDSDDFVTTGFGGTQNTRTGAYDPNASGNNVVRATMYAEPSAILGTAAQIHQGRFRVKARVYATVADTRLRLAWQNEDGPLGRGDWVIPPTINAFAMVDLGVIGPEASGLGTAGWTGRIEAYNAAGGTLDVDFIALIPADYGTGRMGVNVAAGPTALVARDEFTGTTAGGALNGRVPALGAAWTTSGVATDFTFRDADATWNSEAVQRATAADAGFRYGVFGAVAAGQTAQAKLAYTAGVGGQSLGAVIARWVDANNHLRLRLKWTNNTITDPQNLHLEKVVAGTPVTLASGFVVIGVAPDYVQLALTVYPSGRVVAVAYSTWPNYTVTLEATHADLATGGALDDGLVGIADDAGEASTRIFDDVSGFTLADEPILIYAGRDLQVTDERALRANSTGTKYGIPPAGYTGAFPKPPPASVGLSRFAAIMAPNDLETNAWDTINHSAQHQALWTPRVRVVPE